MVPLNLLSRGARYFRAPWALHVARLSLYYMNIEKMLCTSWLTAYGRSKDVRRRHFNPLDGRRTALSRKKM